MTKKQPKSDKPEKPAAPKEPERLDAYMQFLQTTTERTCRALRAIPKPERPLEQPSTPLYGEEHDDFAAFRKSLSSDAAAKIEALVPEAEDAAPTPDANAACFGLVEAENGEWAKMRLFRDVQGMAQRIAAQEGQDIVVWAFYGVPLKLSKGPQRFLMMPDGQNAVKIPMYGNGPVEFVDGGFLEDFEMQDDGFLGPPQLAEGLLPDMPPPKKASPGDFKKKSKGDKKEKSVDDDEEDHPDSPAK